EMVESLGILVDQSLLRLDEQVDGDFRLGMLETIRAYGLKRLAASGEEEEVRRIHAIYFQTLVETAEPALLGPQQVTSAHEVERERDNLRAALSWAREGGETMLGLRIAGALWRFWHLHGYVSEGRRWLDDLLAQENEDNGSEAMAARAKALRSAGGLAFYQGD